MYCIYVYIILKITFVINFMFLYMFTICIMCAFANLKRKQNKGILSQGNIIIFKK